MKGWKWVLLGCGGLFLLSSLACVGLVWMLWSAVAPLGEAGDKFLALLGEGKTHEAYLAAGSAWRAREDEETFTATVRDLGLTGYQSSSWTSRSFDNNVGKLEGTITTKDGGTFPATVELNFEGGAWKVASVAKGVTPKKSDK
jgi:hypothetical protein